MHGYRTSCGAARPGSGHAVGRYGKSVGREMDSGTLSRGAMEADGQAVQTHIIGTAHLLRVLVRRFGELDERAECASDFTALRIQSHARREHRLDSEKIRSHSTYMYDDVTRLRYGHDGLIMDASHLVADSSRNMDDSTRTT